MMLREILQGKGGVFEIVKVRGVLVQNKEVLMHLVLGSKPDLS